MKNCKLCVVAMAVVLCAASLMFAGLTLQATATEGVSVEQVEAVPAPSVEVETTLPWLDADEALSSKAQVQQPAQPKPVPLACGSDSHADCKGKNHGDSCGEEGLGTCNASYPSDECLCL